MEVGLSIISTLVVARFEVIGISVVDVLLILVEYLEFQEVDTLLEEIYISKVF